MVKSARHEPRTSLTHSYTDQMFAPLFATRGQPAETPWRLALVLVLQFAEGLTDRQAADAVRGRIDWKYLLGLELTDPGFDSSILCEFRARILAGSREAQFLDALLTVCKARGWLKARGTQRTDSTHVLAATRSVTRLELVGETVRAALNSLTVAAPVWLQTLAPPAWYDRYSHRVESYRLPKTTEACRALAVTIGEDGAALLTAIYAARTPEWLRHLPAVEVLRRIWIQQYLWQDSELRWRSGDDLPPGGILICTPYDIEARHSQKRSTEWTGYKVHLTETCEPDQPHLIINVETTPVTTPDGAMVPPIHEHLAAQELLPATHLMDTGYVDAEVLVESQATDSIRVCGPVPPDTGWQKRAGAGFDLSGFAVDWEAQTVQCPGGKTSQYWQPRQDRHGHAYTMVRFARDECAVCPLRAKCTKGSKIGRQLALRPQLEFETLQEARMREQGAEFKREYAARAGIEGTISAGVRTKELRRSRYRGAAKTHLQHTLLTVAVNLGRLVVWWQAQEDGVFRRLKPPQFARLNPARPRPSLAGVG